jgi:hypothetical protein
MTRYRLRITFRENLENSDPAHLIGLLRTRNERPCARRRSTPDKRDELASLHVPP